MKRYASIDFLRGVAIFMMIFLHIVSDTLDVEGLLNDINNVPMANLVALIVLPYLGGLAGFFLLISAIGNMISMQKHLQAGKPVNALVVRQVMGGFILLVFAMLTEGVIGYHGAFGDIFMHLDNPAATNWNRVLYGWNNFETIHTIAWCVILNGITQGILARNDGWKDPHKQIRSYIKLGIIVVVLTQFVWIVVYFLVPGFPFATDPNTGWKIHEPYLGQSEPWLVLAAPFLSALAGPMEPLFPYLAVSYAGSAIGVMLAQPREKIPHDFPRKILRVGLGMWIIGSIGVIAVIVGVLMDPTRGFGQAADLYRLISFHRHWSPDAANPAPLFAWLWQFLSLNGFGLMITGIMLRLVEFRGKGKPFAEKTVFIRRFGFIAFTNYAFQWIYHIAFFVISVLLISPYAKLPWGGTLLVIVLAFLIYHFMMRAWERVGYVGSIEWCIGTIAYSVIPAKKTEGTVQKKWYQKGKLDVEGAFYNAEWLNVREEGEMDQENLQESKLAYKIALISLVSVVFMPVSFATFFMARGSMQREGENRFNRIAMRASLVGMIIVVLFFTLAGIFSLSDLGIAL